VLIEAMERLSEWECEETGEREFSSTVITEDRRSTLVVEDPEDFSGSMVEDVCDVYEDVPQSQWSTVFFPGW
jgi:hypothetical protein